MFGGIKANARIIVTPDKITKIYTKRGEKAFQSELKLYKLAKKRVNFIPKLLSYDIEKRTIVIQNVGISLDKLLSNKKLSSVYLPEIKKLYAKF